MRALGTASPMQRNLYRWVKRRFGPRWPIHLGNVLWSTVLLVIACASQAFVFAVLFAAFWGCCVTNTAMLFLVRRDAEREGILDDLDAMRGAE